MELVASTIALATAMVMAATPAWMNVNTPEEHLQEAWAKQARIKNYLETGGYDGLLLTMAPNFRWVTAGGSNDVVATDKFGHFVKVLATPSGMTLIAPNDEAVRVMPEELAGQGYRLEEYSCHEDDSAILKRLCADKKIACDSNVPGTTPAIGLDVLRTPLLPSELTRYRWLGKEAVAAMAETAERIRSGMTEEQVAALLSIAFWERGILPTVMAVAADTRARDYRHCLPTAKRIKNLVMMSVCVRKWGLIVAFTRYISFGPIPEDIKKDFQGASLIQAMVRHHAKPGTAWKDLWRITKEGYAKAGAPDGWKLHSQGGPIGYFERDFVATDKTPGYLQAEQAIAWHPHLGYAKCEETVVAHGDGDLEVLTPIAPWPVQEVTVDGATFAVPAPMIKE